MSLSFLKSKWFAAGGLILCSMFFFFVISELRKKYAIRAEIRKLEAEIAELESQNQEFLELLNYLKTPEYKERQARSLLHLQKPGEFAVALPAREEEQVAAEALPQTPNKSNLQKWWEYFFGR